MFTRELIASDNPTFLFEKNDSDIKVVFTWKKFEKR